MRLRPHVFLNLLQLSQPVRKSHTMALPFKLQRIDHVVFRCHDFRAMYDFYTNTLGCTIDIPSDVGRMGGVLTHLRAGDAFIDLLAYDEASLTDEGRENIRKMQGIAPDTAIADIDFSHEKSTLDHLCIRIDPFDEDELRKYFESKGVEIKSSGQRKGSEGVGPSIYINDPEGNTIELKGPPEN